MYEYWYIYCTLFSLEPKALGGNSTLIESDALVVALTEEIAEFDQAGWGCKCMLRQDGGME